MGSLTCSGTPPIPTEEAKLDSLVDAYEKHVIICLTIASIPPGRQSAKTLQCGICNADRLFDRHYEMKRHMETHFAGTYPCTAVNCKRGPTNPFTRADKLGEHARRVHGST